MIEEYHPTGREREVLEVVKTEEHASKQDVKSVVGCSGYIIDKTLDNLCTAGCVTETGTETYCFEYDPMDELLP